MISKTNSGGGDKINGIIDQYLVDNGENISAGDFVEFTGARIKNQNATARPAAAMGDILAVAIDDSRVLVCYASDEDESQLYARVLTISDGTFLKGTETLLSSRSNSASALSACKIGDDRFFLTHSGANGRLSLVLCATIVTISGDQIEVNTDTILYNEANSGSSADCVALDENRVFITHASGSRLLWAVSVVEISNADGEWLLEASRSVPYTLEQGGTRAKVVLLKPDTVYVTFGTNYDIYGAVLNITQSMVDLGSEPVKVAESASGFRITSSSTVKLSENRIFISFNNDEENYLHGITVDIAENTVENTVTPYTVTANIKTQLSSVESSGYVTSAQVIDEATVFIAHAFTWDFKLYGMIVNVDAGGEIAVIMDDFAIDSKSEAGGVISLAVVVHGNVFVLHSSTSNYFLQALTLPLFAKAHKDRIDGVAKTGGEAGRTIQAYRPK